LFHFSVGALDDSQNYGNSSNFEEMDSETLAAVLQIQFDEERNQLLGQMHTLKKRGTRQITHSSTIYVWTNI
jgi:hypothetical protein